MNTTKETEVVNLRQRGEKIISEDNLDFLLLLYITYKKQFTKAVSYDQHPKMKRDAPACLFIFGRWSYVMALP